MAEAPSPKKMKLDDELDMESKQVDNIITDNTSLHPDVTESTQVQVCCNDVMNTSYYCMYILGQLAAKNGPLMTWGSGGHSPSGCIWVRVPV